MRAGRRAKQREAAWPAELARQREPLVDEIGRLRRGVGEKKRRVISVAMADYRSNMAGGLLALCAPLSVCAPLSGGRFLFYLEEEPPRSTFGAPIPPNPLRR